MRQIALGRRARHIELGDERRGSIERAARHFERRVLLVGPDPERDHGVVGVAERSIRRLSSVAHVGVELRLTGHDRRAQVRQPLAGRFELGRERRWRAASSSAARLLETLNFRSEPRCALDHRGVRGARLGGAAAQVLGRLACLEQAPLRERSGARRPVAADPGGERSTRAASS